MFFWKIRGRKREILGQISKVQFIKKNRQKQYKKNFDGVETFCRILSLNAFCQLFMIVLLKRFNYRRFFQFFFSRPRQSSPLSPNHLTNHLQNEDSIFLILDNQILKNNVFFWGGIFGTKIENAFRRQNHQTPILRYVQNSFIFLLSLVPLSNIKN